MTNATRTLQTLRAELKREQQAVEIQLRAVEGAISALNGRAPARHSRPRPQKPTRKPMSAAERRAISKRMKAMWAKKRGAGK